MKYNNNMTPQQSGMAMQQTQSKLKIKHKALKSEDSQYTP